MISWKKHIVKNKVNKCSRCRLCVDVFDHFFFFPSFQVTVNQMSCAFCVFHCKNSSLFIYSHTHVVNVHWIKRDGFKCLCINPSATLSTSTMQNVMCTQLAMPIFFCRLYTHNYCTNILHTKQRDRDRKRRKSEKKTLHIFSVFSLAWSAYRQTERRRQLEKKYHKNQFFVSLCAIHAHTYTFNSHPNKRKPKTTIHTHNINIRNFDNIVNAYKPF